MPKFFYKGILLQQHKEPALSKNLREFMNADTVATRLDRPQVENPDALSASEIIEIAREAKIVDERNGKMLISVLNRNRGYTPRMVIADAIDDQPYISSQLNPLLKNQQLSAKGLEFAMRATGAKEAQFHVYKNLSDLDVKIPKEIETYQVKRISGRYPSQFEASRAYSGRGTVVVGSGALLHLARAVIYNKPQTTTFVTVAGNCVGSPTNLEVSLGMTIAQVLERCGLVDEPRKVIIGGSMTGISVIDTEHTVVNHTTRAILAFRDEEKDLGFECIGCGRCVAACPQGLNPHMLYQHIKHKQYAELRALDAHMCIECGTCSYVCPAKLNLSVMIKRSNQECRKICGSIRSASVARAKQEQQDFDAYMQEYLEKQAARKALKEAKRQERQQANAAAAVSESQTEAPVIQPTTAEPPIAQTSPAEAASVKSSAAKAESSAAASIETPAIKEKTVPTAEPPAANHNTTAAPATAKAIPAEPLSDKKETGAPVSPPVSPDKTSDAAADTKKPAAAATQEPNLPETKKAVSPAPSSRKATEEPAPKRDGSVTLEDALKAAAELRSKQAESASAQTSSKPAPSPAPNVKREDPPKPAEAAEKKTPPSSETAADKPKSPRRRPPTVEEIVPAVPVSVQQFSSMLGSLIGTYIPGQEDAATQEMSVPEDPKTAQAHDTPALQAAEPAAAIQKDFHEKEEETVDPANGWRKNADQGISEKGDLDR